MRLKYIVTENGPIIFGDGHSHAQVAKNEKVFGAGFVHIEAKHEDDGHISVKCFGNSVSLKQESRGQLDADVIDRLLNYY